MTTRRWQRARLVAVWLVAWVLVAGHAPAWASPAAEISDLTVVDGTVTFTVDAGSATGGQQLDPASITVTADGAPWVASAAPVDDSNTVVPRRAVIVVDTSGSMGERGIADARAAAGAFLDAAPADVSVGLVTFSAQPQLAVEPTLDRQPVRDALGAMRPGGETALYDGMALALSALGSEGDRALVVLSDGEDTASTATFEATRDSLAASGVASHLVAFKTQDAQIQTLRDLAAPAQGMVLEAVDGAQLSDVFTASARALVNQVIVTAKVPEDFRGGETDLLVTLAAGDSTVTAQAAVPVPARVTGPVEVGSLPPTRATGSQPWLQPAVLATSFAALFLLFAVVLAPSTWRTSSGRRRAKDIQRYTLTGGSTATTVTAASPSAVTEAALAWADRRIQQRGVEDDWQLLLDRAGLPLKPHEWLIIKMVAAVVGVAAAVLVLPWWALTGPLLGALAWIVTGLFLKVKAARRSGKFGEELPDVLQLVAGSLGSGFSFPQAIDNAANEGPDPIAGELSRALAETRLGVQLEDALERVATRMASTDLAWTVMAVRISREVGGNLGEVLLSTAETMRERGRIRRQVKALSAEGRLSAYILIGLPVAIALWMGMFRPAYVAPLVTHPLGLAMTAFAVISMAVGAWWMSRLVKLEV